MSAEVGVIRIPCADISLCVDGSSMGRSTNAMRIGEASCGGDGVSDGR